MTQRRRRQVVEEEPLLFDLPLAAPAPADRRARQSPRPAPVQVDLFSTEVEEEIDADDSDAVVEEDEEAAVAAASAAVAAELDEEAAHEIPSGPIVAGVTTRFLAGCADAVLHLGVLGAAYLGVLALDVEPGPNDWPAFALLLVAFSFLSSVVSLAFWGQTAGMAWRRLQTRDRLQRPLTFRQAALRWVGGLVTFATAGLPLLFALGGASLGDWLSRSVTYSMAAPQPQRRS
jgi:hypothetical protein